MNRVPGFVPDCALYVDLLLLLLLHFLIIQKCIRIYCASRKTHFTVCSKIIVIIFCFSSEPIQHILKFRWIVRSFRFDRPNVRIYDIWICVCVFSFCKNEAAHGLFVCIRRKEESGRTNALAPALKLVFVCVWVFCILWIH